MHLARRVKSLPRVTTQHTRSISKRLSRNYSVKSESEERIEIPNRVHRSPTDILYALSSTVGRDPTAAHYKYHDDPYLIPNSNVSKRTFAMAQEAGRKAAMWIKDQHRDLFMHQEAQPAIADFAPKQVFHEGSDVDAATLEQLIYQSQVNDAVLVYNLLKEKNIEISNELKQKMLELVSFYNNEEPLPEEYVEERWFTQNAIPRGRHNKTWKDSELAEQLFAEIEPKTATAYAALIRGMAKYNQVERAHALLQEAMERKFELDTTTFNAVINVSYLLRENADQRWELCQELLQQMAQLKLKPNTGTLNALLETISTFGNFKLARGSALKVLAEMRSLGVEPSFASFYYLLIIFCRERSPVSHIIVDILNEIKDKEFSIVHPKDTMFFVTAMDVCRNHLHDKSLAKKVDALLHTGNNYDLIGDSYKESIYYRHYFALLCQTETIEDFMQTYNSLVPNIYIPEPGIMDEILKAIESNAAAELVPRIWSDIIAFNYTNRESLLTRILTIMEANIPDVEKPSQRQLPEQFAKVAFDIYTKVEESQDRSRKLTFTGQMIGDILTILVRGEQFEKATQVFNTIDKNQHLITGTPSEKCLMEYIDACVANKTPSQAMQCLQYAVENNMEATPIARGIHQGFTLSEVHLSKMRSLVGESFLSQ